MAGYVSAVTCMSIPTAATTLSPVPTMNERKEPKPTRIAFGKSPRSLSNSPATAPTNGPRMMPMGGKMKNQANTPTVAPMAPAREPPNLRVIHAGRK